MIIPDLVRAQAFAKDYYVGKGEAREPLDALSSTLSHCPASITSFVPFVIFVVGSKLKWSENIMSFQRINTTRDFPSGLLQNLD
jgi:hypothetical protein